MEKIKHPVNLGQIYRDPPSGFIGTATGVAYYLEDTPNVRLTADTGQMGDLKEVWLSVKRVVPHQQGSTGFTPTEKNE